MLIKFASVSCVVFLVACGESRPKAGDVIIPLDRPVATSDRTSRQSEDAQGSRANGEQPINATTPAPGAPVPMPSAPKVVPMTLEQAKQKCVACHQPNAMGARVWSTANGSETDWKAFAVAAKASVAAGRMPIGTPLTAEEKASFIAYMDQLLGVTPGDGSQGDVPPPPLKYTFESARVLCVGCHSASAPASIRQKPKLDTLADWREELEDIDEEVRRGRMPMGKRLSDAERKALIEFIGTLWQ